MAYLQYNRHRDLVSELSHVLVEMCDLLLVERLQQEIKISRQPDHHSSTKKITHTYRQTDRQTDRHTYLVDSDQLEHLEYSLVHVLHLLLVRVLLCLQSTA